jgi:very-short-patch-repair endonuclease
MVNVRARTLRLNMTAAERLFWRAVRDRQVEGAKFRRQFPIGPYVVDFVCLDARLIVELDGGQHADSIKDEDRTAWLQGEGFDVIRFWNNEVQENLGGVLWSVAEALKRPLTPALSHKGRGS